MRGEGVSAVHRRPNKLRRSNSIFNLCRHQNNAAAYVLYLSLSLSSLVGVKPMSKNDLVLPPGWRKKLWGESACPPAGRPGTKQVAGPAAQQLQASTQPLSLPPQVPANSRYNNSFCVKVLKCFANQCCCWDSSPYRHVCIFTMGLF
jgi:hypothetical protein